MVRPARAPCSRGAAHPGELNRRPARPRRAAVDRSIPMYFPGTTSYWWVRCPIDYEVPDHGDQEEEAALEEEGFEHEEGCNEHHQPFVSDHALHNTHTLLFLIGLSTCPSRRT